MVKNVTLTSSLNSFWESLQNNFSWTPAQIQVFQNFVQNGRDEDLFRINPYILAPQLGLSSKECIDLLIQTCKVNLFRMDWELVCPACGDHVSQFASASHLDNLVHCSMCNIKTEASLDDLIQITFTINPTVKIIRYHLPESLSVEDFTYEFHFSKHARFENGPLFKDILKQTCLFLGWVEPGQKIEIKVSAAEGLLRIGDITSGATVPVPVAALSGDEQAQLTLANGVLTCSSVCFKAGPIKITFQNTTDHRVAISAFNWPASAANNARPKLVFGEYLSGAKLLATQTFRDLFRRETFKSSEGIGVKNLTVLFTDLKGSTKMYGDIGDIKAFSIVNQHFELLQMVIDAHEGAVVKTIGDAVMAIFVEPLQAVKAAIEMHAKIDGFNQSSGHEALGLKIGIHSGNSIAVTLNEQVDYFGQTVNIAARVQGLANSEETYITHQVRQDPQVSNILKNIDLERRFAKLRGVQEEVEIYKIMYSSEVLKEIGI